MKIRILLFLTIIMACEKSPLERDVEIFTDSNVKLMLDSMVNVHSEESFSERKPYLYISYVDSNSCSGCELSHFLDWDEVRHNTDTLKYDHIFIVRPKRNEICQVIEKVGTGILSDFNVFVDTTDIFERSNPQLPKNKLLHTFMLDSLHNVVLVGSPVANKKIEELLRDVLSNRKIH